MAIARLPTGNEQHSKQVWTCLGEIVVLCMVKLELQQFNQVSGPGLGLGWGFLYGEKGQGT